MLIRYKAFAARSATASLTRISESYKRRQNCNAFEFVLGHCRSTYKVKLIRFSDIVAVRIASDHDVRIQMTFGAGLLSHAITEVLIVRNEA